MAPRNKDGTRPLGPIDPNWQPVANAKGNLARAVRADLVAVFAEHEAAGTLPRSPRGAFYDLMPAGRGNSATYVKPIKGQQVRADHKSMQAHPDYVSEKLEDLRRQGIIPEDWVADARAPRPIRWAGQPYDEPLDDEADRIVELLEKEADAWGLDWQSRQAHRLGLFVEAEGMMARMRTIASRYGVPIFSGSGFAGLKGIREFAEDAAFRDVPSVILTITDYDTHGLLIADRVADDAVEWFEQGPDNINYRRWVERGRPKSPAKGPRPIPTTKPGTPGLEFVRIGITPEQAARYPERQDALGHMQAEGMPVADMDALVEGAIRERVDLVRLQRVQLVEEKRRDRLHDLIAERLEDRQ